MIRIIKTQVIIVGAGPAGAATSIFLSKAGISHVILEKEKFPRDKVCGDACGGKTSTTETCHEHSFHNTVSSIMRYITNIYCYNLNFETYQTEF